ncbi:expressed unknown protein [Seminavis robusta]|uniref:DUF4442 domain-containing protein n=1 Tax=Seminavis robusta TaxID=568900 RepID=A0A9N8DNK2_9STRA|nr:expressed unknown protein [Seminavis robusta]|eukprot:Sro261_g101810.1 n/a (173) ;mRNA; f:59047-59565
MAKVLHKLSSKLNFPPSTILKTAINYWPPLLGAGVRVVKLSKDFRYAKIAMPLRWYNRNYVGTHFGGSLYSMTDPWFMLQLLNVLGKDYIVWDKGANIDYKSPGKGCVTAEFVLKDDLIQSLRELNPEEKRVFDLPVEVKDKGGNVVAEVTKKLYVKRKAQQQQQPMPRSKL